MPPGPITPASVTHAGARRRNPNGRIAETQPMVLQSHRSVAPDSNESVVWEGATAVVVDDAVWGGAESIRERQEVTVPSSCC